jgi:hypothetical protein
MRIAAASVLLSLQSPTLAADDEVELWLNPSVITSIDERTSIELETAQRLRAAPADDTYYLRFWVNRVVDHGPEVAAGIERRFEGAAKEIRLLQQASYSLGPIRLRSRLEQRFISSDPRTGWRWRQRVGTKLPLAGGENAWTAVAHVEGFLTLRASAPSGSTGLTGIRSFVGVERTFGRAELSFGYLRQQTISEGRPDRVGHAPLLGLSLVL